MIGIVKVYTRFVVVGVTIITLFLFFVFPVEAQTNSELIRSLQAQVDLLLQQVRSLQSRLTQTSQISIEGEVDAVGDISDFDAFLELGIQGKRVQELQKFLSLFSDIYPEGLTTGYFGVLTERAVKRFQARYGIEQVGWVGPQTRLRLNLLLEEKKQVLLERGLSSPSSQNNISVTVPGVSTTTAQILKNLSLTDVSQFTLHPRPQYNPFLLRSEIHNLINQKRLENGLPVLSYDISLEEIALLHSKDQAKDNIETTDSKIPCSFPLIRHEGFSFGFTLKERLEAKGYAFRRAGENIGILPLIKSGIYQYSDDEVKQFCAAVRPFEPGPGTQEERTALYQEIFSEHVIAARSLSPVEWVHREWFTESEIAKRIVEGWMDSEGHRKNILTREFALGGIGIAEVNDYFVITHDLAQK